MTAATLGPGPVILAVDVGGTHTKAARFNATGQPEEIVRTTTPVSTDGSADALLDHLAHIEHTLHTPGQSRPEAFGLSVPGIVDELGGMALAAANLGWRNAPLRDLATARLGLPVAFGHDVRAAAVAELHLGAASRARNAVVLVIGTGISGAVILDGVVRAADGFAGEFGHSLGTPGGEPCPCGAVGCVERRASAAAIARRYRALSGDTQVHGAREVLARATIGDPHANAAWNEAIEALIETIARIAAFLGPEVVVIGGGLSRAGEALFRPLREGVPKLLSIHRVPEIVPAALSEDAGLLGTAIAARELADSGSIAQRAQRSTAPMLGTQDFR